MPLSAVYNNNDNEQQSQQKEPSFRDTNKREALYIDPESPSYEAPYTLLALLVLVVLMVLALWCVFALYSGENIEGLFFCFPTGYSCGYE